METEMRQIECVADMQYRGIKISNENSGGKQE